MIDAPRNHWDENGDLVVEEKTLFRHVGWVGQSGRFYEVHSVAIQSEPGGFSPLFQQIATWKAGEGWQD